MGLVASGAWFAAAPRADQPLLDSVEHALPAVRGLYMTRLEASVYADTDRYAERYRREAERVNEREASSRWQGEAMSDEQVARVSSLLRSYSEMRKGEQYVQREVRARARERERWPIGFLLAAAGLLGVPWRRLAAKADSARKGKGSPTPGR
jgi:zinc/manganese transport system permease protein